MKNYMRQMMLLKPPYSPLETYHKMATPAALVMLAINLVFLCWYLFIGYQSSFHSDSAAKVLLAREIYDSVDFFPDDWNYVNNDLFIIFGHVFILPLLVILPAGFEAHAISGLISSALILFGVWLLTGMSQISTARRVLIVAIVAAGISAWLAENLFGQASYGTIFYIACFLIYFSVRFFMAEKGQAKRWGIALLVLITLIYWSNPTRATVTYGLPLIASAFLVHMRYSSALLRKQALWQLLGVAFAGMAIGVALHLYTIAGVNNIFEVAQARWLSYDLMIRNLTLTPQGVLAIFGGLPTAGALVTSLSGLYEAARLAVVIVIIALIPVAIVKIIQQNESRMLFLGAFTFIAFFGVMFIHASTSVPTMSDPIGSSRYLVPSLLLGLIILLMQPIHISRSPLFGISVVAVFVALLTSAVPAFVLSNPSLGTNSSMPGKFNVQHKRVASFLKDNGLHYGYASYWNAGVISVKSGENVLVRQIGVDMGIPVPMRHLSSDRWYKPSAWTGKTFLLLTDEEAKKINWMRMATYKANPIRELSFQNFRVFVFNDNIAALLPGWDLSFEKPANFPASHFSLKQTGRFVEGTPYSPPALVAEKGELGALHFGPYINMPRGTYVVTFDVTAEHHPGGAFRLDVAAAPDQKIFAEKVLFSSSSPQSLNFTLGETRTMEFRVFSHGNQQVILRSITVERVKPGENVRD